MQSKIGVPAVFLQVRNGGVWDRDCSSQTPGHPDTAGNLEDLKLRAPILLCTHTMLGMLRSRRQGPQAYEEPGTGESDLAKSECQEGRGDGRLRYSSVCRLVEDVDV